jgi:hypothetical protein
MWADRRRQVMFPRCRCVDADGSRRVCVPPTAGFQCERLAACIKTVHVSPRMKAARDWEARNAVQLDDVVTVPECDAARILGARRRAPQHCACGSGDRRAGARLPRLKAFACLRTLRQSMRTRHSGSRCAALCVCIAPACVRRAARVEIPLLPPPLLLTARRGMDGCTVTLCRRATRLLRKRGPLRRYDATPLPPLGAAACACQ